MKIAILGAGNGGCAAAADWALAGFRVNLFDFEAFPENIQAINKQGGVVAEGDIQGLAPVEYAGHSIKKALEDAALIMMIGPAFSTKPLAEVMRPHIRKGQIIIVCPGSSGGAFEVKKVLENTINIEEITISETATLPYACRMTAPGRVKIFLKLHGGLYLAALPASKTDGALEVFRKVYPGASAVQNVFQTILQNANPIIHPAVTLLNAGLIERTSGNFNFYEDGVTRAVGNLIEGLDRERIAIGKQLGLDILPDPVIGVMQGYMQNEDYQTGYTSAEGFRGIKAQNKLDHRYLNEDVGFGLVFMTELGSLLGVKTPIMNAVIDIASCIMNRNYRSEGARTLKSLGMRACSVEELLSLV
jgi:opine dehydrogenase